MKPFAAETRGDDLHVLYRGRNHTFHPVRQIQPRILATCNPVVSKKVDIPEPEWRQETGNGSEIFFVVVHSRNHEYSDDHDTPIFRKQP